MITLAYHPTVQSIIDRWRIHLPVPVQVDESQLTKEHLRLLVRMLVEAIDSPGTMDGQSTDRPLAETINNQLHESIFDPGGNRRPSTFNEERSTTPSPVLGRSSNSQPQFSS